MAIYFFIEGSDVIGKSIGFEALHIQQLKLDFGTSYSNCLANVRLYYDNLYCPLRKHTRRVN